MRVAVEILTTCARLAAQGRAYVEGEHGWPTVTERLRQPLGRLVA